MRFGAICHLVPAEVAVTAISHPGVAANYVTALCLSLRRSTQLPDRASFYIRGKRGSRKITPRFPNLALVRECFLFVFRHLLLLFLFTTFYYGHAMTRYVFTREKRLINHSCSFEFCFVSSFTVSCSDIYFVECQVGSGMKGVTSQTERRKIRKSASPSSKSEPMRPTKHRDRNGKAISNNAKTNRNKMKTKIAGRRKKRR